MELLINQELQLIFTSLADANINVDMIVQTVGVDGKTDLDFTIPKTDWEICKKLWKI